MQQQEAVNFVEDVPKLSSPLSKLRENKALILNEPSRPFSLYLFRTFIFSVKRKLEDMSIPTWEDSVMRGYGGLCYSLCLFMKYLLEALGYDVYFVAFGCPGNHIHPGSHHIVDNIAFPTFEAIPLD